MRVLVIDDEAPVRKLTREILAEAGFETAGAADPVSGTWELRRFRPDLVLLDLEMPQGGGWEFLARVAAPPKGPAVVILSGQQSPEVFERAMRAGVVGFLTKPIHYGEVVAACRTAIERANAPPPPAAEQRLSPRRQVLVPVTLTSKVGTPQVVAELADLSVGGARVILVEALPAGASVTLAVDPSVTGSPLQLAGCVRWCRPLPAGYEHGVEFVELTDEARERLERWTAPPETP